MIFPICLYGKMRGALLNTFVDLIRLSYLNQAEPPCSQHHGCAYLGPADTGAARCARRQRPAVGKSALQGGPQRWRRHRDDQSRHSVRTLARRPGTQFDALKLNWIGSPNWDTTVAPRARTCRFRRATGADEDTATYPELPSAIVGMKFKVVRGCRGSHASCGRWRASPSSPRCFRRARQGTWSRARSPALAAPHGPNGQRRPPYGLL